MLLSACVFCLVFELPYIFSVSATLEFCVLHYENYSSSPPTPPQKQALSEEVRAAGSLVFLSVQKAKIHRPNSVCIAGW